MSARISSSQREVQHRRQLFVAAFAETGNASAAAVAAGYSERSAGTMGDRLMHEAGTAARAREARRQYVESSMSDFQRQQAALCAAADDAIRVLVEISAAAPRVGALARVQAAVAILDRAGHKPIERIEQQVAWADVTRELAGIDTAQVLREALDAIGERPDALPGPSDG